jgi:hypothetical protein
MPRVTHLKTKRSAAAGYRKQAVERHFQTVRVWFWEAPCRGQSEKMTPNLDEQAVI